MMKNLVRCALAVGLAAASCGAFAASATVAVPLTVQEHSQWCWAASSAAVLSVFGQTPSQCAIVNYAFSRTDACGNSTFDWSSQANRPNSITAIRNVLTKWGRAATSSNASLSWANTTADLGAGRPIVMGWLWTGGGGHALVAYGYDDGSGTRRLSYMDPWPGEGMTTSDFSWVESASDHRWAMSARVTR